MVQTDLASDAGKHSGIQVIARAAAVMRALGSNPQGLSLAAIAQIVDLPRSTVQRIITALEAEFLVEALGPVAVFALARRWDSSSARPKPTSSHCSNRRCSS